MQILQGGERDEEAVYFGYDNAVCISDRGRVQAAWELLAWDFGHGAFCFGVFAQLLEQAVVQVFEEVILGTGEEVYGRGWRAFDCFFPGCPSHSSVYLALLLSWFQYSFSRGYP